MAERDEFLFEIDIPARSLTESSLESTIQQLRDLPTPNIDKIDPFAILAELRGDDGDIPFANPESRRIAVRVINHLSSEVMEVFRA